MKWLKSWMYFHFWRFVTGLCILFFLWIIRSDIIPKWHALKMRMEVLEVNEQTLAEIDNWEIEKGKYAAQINLLEQQVEDLYGSIPRNDHISILLDKLKESSAGLSLQIREIHRKPPVNNKLQQEQTLHVVASGAFHEVAAFIDGMERSAYLINVASLHIERKSVWDSTVLAELDLRAIIVKR